MTALIGAQPLSDVPLDAHVRLAPRLDLCVVVGMSEQSDPMPVLRFAAREAAYRGGDVLALHVLRQSTGGTHGLASLPEARASADRESDTVLLGLRQAVGRLMDERARAAEPVVAVHTEVRRGFASLELMTVGSGAAMLVLGAGQHPWLLGPVSAALASTPMCPIIIVPVSGSGA